MNDKAVWSQSASYACMWYSNPPSLLPQREVSKLQKKGGKKKRGVVCVQVFNNKPSDSPPTSHQVSLLQSGGKAHVIQNKWGSPPESAAKPTSIAREVPKREVPRERRR